MSGILQQPPDIGITKKTRNGVSVWTVDLSIYSMTSTQARQVAAEILNMADQADLLNQAIKDDQP